MEDWAETRAREFCNERWPSQRVEADDLAALLREVYGQARSETLVRCCICQDVTAPRPDCECVICHRNRTLVEVRRRLVDEAPLALCEDESAVLDWVRNTLESL